MDFATLVQTLTDWIVRIGGTVNELPGTAAFALGLFTWFSVERMLARLMTGIKWAILMGVIVALGLTLPYLASLLWGSGVEEVPVP